MKDKKMAVVIVFWAAFIIAFIFVLEPAAKRQQDRIMDYCADKPPDHKIPVTIDWPLFNTTTECRHYKYEEFKAGQIGGPV